MKDVEGCHIALPFPSSRRMFAFAEVKKKTFCISNTFYVNFMIVLKKNKLEDKTRAGKFGGNINELLTFMEMI